MENRKFFIRTFVILIGILFLVKLFNIQVISKSYKLAAENNIVQRIIEYPYRGLIYDRNRQLLVVNDPIYDLMIVPKEVQVSDTADFCAMMKIDKATFMQKYNEARKYSLIKPSVFQKQLSNDEFAAIQDRLIDFRGFYIVARSVREYPYSTLANALGYIGEISKRQLDSDTTKYYRMGDYIGISGIEERYEKSLRGHRGVKYKMVNVRGVEKGSFLDGQHDTLSSPGEDLISSIDLGLQEYAEDLLGGKVGSLVAIEPATGEILSIVSSPSYDPNILSGRNFPSNFQKLQSDTLVPLFNRPIMAMYPPGSMFKTVQALVAMQERVISPTELVYCDGSLIGDLAPPGYYDITEGITYSSNNFFFRVFRRIINQNRDPNTFIDSRIGLEKWRQYLSKFNLGHVPVIDLPNPKGGFIPGVDYYDRYYGRNRWKFSNIYSLSIGQGETLVTPLQMANLAAIIANRGHYYDPHIIKSIGNTGLPEERFRTKHDVGIDSVFYKYVINGMEQVIRIGSGRRAFIEDIAVCGKTSTAENPHGEDHSGFVAFAPKDNPRIAIAVYVENAGWGGRAAASIGSLVIEKYLRGEITRPWLEEYVLKGEFIY
ncbi:MAG TPA: penicillin-binding transpeptidase domain-containing protein [Cyclobacteriaceae bacterium]|nr:penicillin-binding transpeptidase domain-containing protein [Cyclobacteriaceae bacterium]